MLPLVAQLRFDDARRLACAGNAAAEGLSYGVGAGALLVLPLALWLRARLAAEGMSGTWAACALLAGVFQVIAMLGQVASDCLSGHALSIFVGCATPWFIAALLLRSAVAPTPPGLRGDDRGDSGGLP